MKSLAAVLLLAGTSAVALPVPSWRCMWEWNVCHPLVNTHTDLDIGPMPNSTLAGLRPIISGLGPVISRPIISRPVLPGPVGAAASGVPRGRANATLAAPSAASAAAVPTGILRHGAALEPRMVVPPGAPRRHGAFFGLRPATPARNGTAVPAVGWNAAAAPAPWREANHTAPVAILKAAAAPALGHAADDTPVGLNETAVPGRESPATAARTAAPVAEIDNALDDAHTRLWTSAVVAGATGPAPHDARYPGWELDTLADEVRTERADGPVTAALVRAAETAGADPALVREVRRRVARGLKVGLGAAPEPREPAPVALALARGIEEGVAAHHAAAAAAVPVSPAEVQSAAARLLRAFVDGLRGPDASAPAPTA